MYVFNMKIEGVYRNWGREDDHEWHEYVTFVNTLSHLPPCLSLTLYPFSPSLSFSLLPLTQSTVMVLLVATRTWEAQGTNDG